MNFVVDDGAGSTPIVGTIQWNAASTTATIDSLVSINMTIAGHVYTLAEIGFTTGLNNLIGGTLNGVTVLAAFTNDFGIDWNRTSLNPGTFAFVTNSIFPKFWTNFTTFSVTGDTSVPEPTTLALMSLGLLGLDLTDVKDFNSSISPSHNAPSLGRFNM